VITAIVVGVLWLLTLGSAVVESHTYDAGMSWRHRLSRPACVMMLACSACLLISIVVLL
jgi:hypothetical protein